MCREYDSVEFSHLQTKATSLTHPQVSEIITQKGEDRQADLIQGGDSGKPAGSLAQGWTGFYRAVYLKLLSLVGEHQAF